MIIELDTEQQACVTIVVEEGPHTSATARLISISERKLTIQCDLAAADIGVPVKIEWSHYLVLAEVADREPAGVIILQIRHALDMRAVEQIRCKWM